MSSDEFLGKRFELAAKLMAACLSGPLMQRRVFNPSKDWDVEFFESLA